MSEHTKEPWNGKNIPLTASALERAGFCIVFTNNPATKDEAEANARRIVACVNALHGVSTDHLEQYGLPDFAQKISDLIQQRDNLLADVEAINSIDARFCGRLALILECAILDPHGHFELACQLLEEYKAEWEKVNPSPPTFMGEPMPPERRARLLEMKAKRNVPANS
jgi:hypothetical protein